MDTMSRACPDYSGDGFGYSCDGRTHYCAQWDEELQRWVYIDARCPNAAEPRS